MIAHCSKTATLFTRRTVVVVYHTWTSHCYFIRLYRATECAIAGYALLLHHYGSLFFRCINKTYRSVPFPFHKTRRLFEAQKILLGGCLISFAQDEISDDEFASTVKRFVVNPDSLSEISHESLSDPNFEFPPDSPAVTHNAATPVHGCSESDDFTNPPLTVIVRQLRNKVINLTEDFFRGRISGGEHVESAQPPALLDTSHSNRLDVYFSSLLPKLEIRPSGDGFVNDSWEPIIKKSNLHIWRHPLPEQEQALEKGNFEPTETSRRLTAKYEYRLCGAFQDISALSFLEVQLNLDYRRHWDSRVVALEYIHPTNGTHKSGPGDCDTIRWVTKFPFPFAQREYIYRRRWWLEPGNIQFRVKRDQCSDTQIASTDGELASYGRYAIVLSRSSLSSTEDPSIKRGFGDWTKRLKRQSPIVVTAYRSALLIEAHTQFDKPGMNYYLVYYDDPRFSVGNPTIGLVVGKAMDQFMEQLHDAALKLYQHGLPENTDAVVFRRNTRNSNESSASPSGSTSPPLSAVDSDAGLISQPKPPLSDSQFLKSES